MAAPDERPTDPANPVLPAPWRDRYLQDLSDKEATAGGSDDDAGDCFLSDYWNSPERDVENHVIARVGDGAAAGMVLLNKYPYSNGHLLIALGEGRSRLMDYDAEQRAALWRMVDLASDLLERTLPLQGLNIGVNQGRAAGAGVPQHLHVHVVPRWSGDTNFITVVGRVRVNPTALEDMACRLRETWESMA